MNGFREVDGRRENSEETHLRRFFAPVPKAPDERRYLLYTALAAGTILLSVFLFLGTNEPSILVPILGMTALALGAFQAASLVSARIRYQRALRAIFPRPSEQEVTAQLEQRLQRLIRHSQLKLGLDAIEGIKPLTLFNDIHWYTPGITREDLVYQNTARGTISGVYSFVAIWLTQYRLAAFACTYNFLRDSILNERMAEFFYDDIVSISLAEESSSLTTPSGQSLRTSQRLRIAVANSEFFVVTVDSPQLRQRLELEAAPQEPVERMLAAVRKKLQERRTAADRRDEGRYAGLS